MTAGATFRLTTIVAVSFLTIAAIPSVVLAQKSIVAESIVAACVPDIKSQCAGAAGEGPSDVHQGSLQRVFFGLPAWAGKAGCHQEGL